MAASQSTKLSYFAPDYFAARERFLALARERGAATAFYSMRARGPGGAALSIDTAYLGAPAPRRLLICSSGTHGVEGFAGSAIQQQWLDTAANSLPQDAGCLLIHAVNPYGFAWSRRTNEHNVDLNRNALDQFPGPPNPAYRKLDAWLNPPVPPRALDLFVPHGLWLAATRGPAALRQAILRGQYEFPRGLFYGGERTEESVAHIERIIAAPAFRDVERVVVVDLHTGFGPAGRYMLMVETAPETPGYRDLARWCGADKVGSSQDPRSRVYTASGGIAELMERRFTPARARVAVLEFGTIPVVQMLHQLHRENRAFHYSGPASMELARERAALRRAFCPLNPAWRLRVLAQAEHVLTQVSQALRERRTPLAGARRYGLSSDLS